MKTSQKELLAGALGTVVGIWAARSVARKLPIFDDGTAVFATRDEDALRDVVEALEMVIDVPPTMMLDTTDVKRRFYPNRIVNTTSSGLRKIMHDPACGYGVVSKEPHEDAEKFAAYLRHFKTTTGKPKYKVDVIHNFDPDVPDGSMSEVWSDILQDGCFIFRKSVFKLGKPPHRYHPDQV